MWNVLLLDVSAPSLATFQRQLETFLFQQSYLDLIIYCTFGTVVVIEVILVT